MFDLTMLYLPYLCLIFHKNYCFIKICSNQCNLGPTILITKLAFYFTFTFHGITSSIIFSAAGSDLNPEQDSLDGQMPSGRSMLVTIEPSSRHSPPSGEYIFNVPFKCTNGVTSDPSNLHCTLRLGTEPTLICR